MTTNRGCCHGTSGEKWVTGTRNRLPELPFRSACSAPSTAGSDDPCAHARLSRVGSGGAYGVCDPDGKLSAASPAAILASAVGPGPAAGLEVGYGTNSGMLDHGWPEPPGACKVPVSAWGMSEAARTGRWREGLPGRARGARENSGRRRRTTSSQTACHGYRSQACPR